MALASDFNDSKWLRQAFMVGDRPTAIYRRDNVHRNYNAALNKFTDTTPGGNFSINMPPQPTRYADVKNHTLKEHRNAVNVMANKIAVNIGLREGAFAENSSSETLTTEQGTDKRVYADYSGDNANAWTTLQNSLPDLYRRPGGIDVYAMATRAQRLNDSFLRAQINAIEESNSQAEIENKISSIMAGAFPKSDGGGQNIQAYNESYRKSILGIKREQATIEAATKAGRSTLKMEEDGFMDYLNAELRDGAKWISFRLDEAGSIGESFTNSTKAPSIVETINGISNTAKSLRENTMDFNLGFGIIGDTLNLFKDAVTNLTQGTLDGVGLSGLAVLGGGAFADIQNVWEDSQATLPTESFTIQLRTPYGNKLSIFQNLYIPLSMILAGALPLSTGPSSYTAPFMCQCFVPGRMQTRCGMITDLQITRGTSNAGWSVDGLPLGIDITFTVTDMSSILHMPIDERSGLFDDDNAFNDYMAVLSAVGVAEQQYPVEKLKRAWANKVTQWESMASPAAMAQWTAGTLPGRVLSSFYRNRAGL